MLLDTNKLKLKLSKLKNKKISVLDIQNLLSECGSDTSDKYIKDGKYAVLVSGGYGAGFSTWCDIEAHNYKLIKFLYDSDFVRKDGYLNIKDRKVIHTFIKSKITTKPQYLEGLWSSHIEWVSFGDDYRINEYDGFETLEII